MKILNFLKIRKFVKKEKLTQLLCQGRHLIVEHYVCEKTNKSKYIFKIQPININEDLKGYFETVAFSDIKDLQRMKERAKKLDLPDVACLCEDKQNAIEIRKNIKEMMESTLEKYNVGTSD